MRSWFMFNEFDTRAFGVLLEKEAPVQRGQERITEITIPGRAGELTLTEGEGVYKSYVQRVNAKVHGTAALAELIRALMGEGFVTFSAEPYYKQRARVINPLDFIRVSPGLDWYEGEIQFKCNPYKQLISEATDTLAATDSLLNSGCCPEKPRYTLAGSGTLTLTVNGAAFSVAEVQGGCIIDCETQTVTGLDGLTLITNKSSGEFPVLSKGYNNIVHNAVSAVVERRQRFL